MGSIPCFTATLAVTLALQVPALAQGNQVSPPQAPVPAPSQSQVQPPQPQDSDYHRFAFHRIDGGLLRLDLRTGAVASCTPNGSDWDCVPGRDERAALDREVAQLQRDNAILKNALLEHGVPLPNGMAPTPPAKSGGWGDESIPRPPQTVPPTASAPETLPQGESALDRVIEAVESGWRRLVEMVTNLQQDLQKKE